MTKNSTALALAEVRDQLVTAQARIEELDRIAHTDELTGLRNRRALYTDTHVGDELGTLYVTVVDLDGLKQVNDDYGHAAGDAMIRAAADILAVVAHLEKGTAYRTGGDEFVLVTALNPRDALRNAAELHASHATVSTAGDLLLDDAVNRADSLMYVAKRARRAAR